MLHGARMSRAARERSRLFARLPDEQPALLNAIVSETGQAPRVRRVSLICDRHHKKEERAE
jgi:hypothetical protein